MAENENSLYDHTPTLQTATTNRVSNKDKDLLIFVYITSAPSHFHLRNSIRKTWLLPCIKSPLCQYKFFIDQSRSISNSQDEESLQYQDLVYRDSCELMNRHPSYINYGNSPPSKENLEYIITNITTGNITKIIPLPDYKYRRFYKIDWKICFLKYANQSNQLAAYHAFVEDDSYICMSNLLYQCMLLNKQSHQSFRTGSPMYDGFDDSSTFMSKDVALVFINHYPYHGLNCNKLIENKNQLDHSMWLSWGNSWMSRHCDWYHLLQHKFNLTVNNPIIHCMKAIGSIYTNTKTGAVPSIYFPCMKHPLILHHPHADVVILNNKEIYDDLYNEIKKKDHMLIQKDIMNSEYIKNISNEQVQHICEYMLFIDKVKEPSTMVSIWDHTKDAHSYHDLSQVFLSTNESGWLETLKTLAIDEQQCIIASKSTSSLSSMIDKNDISNNDHDSKEKYNIHLNCLFHEKRKLLQYNKIHNQLYNQSAIESLVITNKQLLYINQMIKQITTNNISINKIFNNNIMRDKNNNIDKGSNFFYSRDYSIITKY